MNQDLGLKVLSQIMRWDDDRARKEFAWLKLMARLKYDGYRDFQAGMRFIESLVTWLQQFKQQERETAYEFVRRTLVYIGPGEMQRLVEQFYPSTVRDRLVRMVADECGIQPYRVLADKKARAAEKRLRRQTLFMGLSDGAAHRHDPPCQFGLAWQRAIRPGRTGRYREMEGSARQSSQGLERSKCTIPLVYLIDDFTATGTSFLRFDEEKREWKGKLIRFKDSVESARMAPGGDKLFEDDWELCIHHYMASQAAAYAIGTRLEKAKAAEIFHKDWVREMHISFGTILPPDLPINVVPGRHDGFISLTQIDYDPTLRTKHTDIGGVTHIGLGYGGCALPLVLEHNTPNNAVALLWAETDGGVRGDGPAPAMRPLFRRRQRHF